jgi:hypothetical protein
VFIDQMEAQKRHIRTFGSSGFVSVIFVRSRQAKWATARLMAASRSVRRFFPSSVRFSRWARRVYFGPLLWHRS